MTVTREELAAYADGELGPEDRTRVAKALAADPALRRQLDTHRQLRIMLSAHYDPILEQDVPKQLAKTVKKGAPRKPAGAEDAVESDRSDDAETVSFTEAEAAGADEVEATDARRRLPRWSYLAALVLAASLVAIAVFWLRG